MFSEPAILVRGIGKRFNIPVVDPYKALHARLERILRRPFERAPEQPFWALRDVSFQVNKGEIFGIVGGNGAGKSVLLRILSRIIKPTTGHAEIHGRLSSIIQLGVGVHPELTGRANVYHSGTILGLSRKQIDGRFDEIISFAGLEEFVDRPVKTYSTGMQMRLAFSISVQLEAEILLIDEALAVGDEVFRAKSMERMQRMLTMGRTVVIVSHDLGFIQSYCHRVLVLNRGRMLGVGRPDEVLELQKTPLPEGAFSTSA